jgi:hypothetical protein
MLATNMPRNMLPLITHLLDSVEAEPTGRGNFAIESFSNGQINRDDFTATVNMLEPIDGLTKPGTAIACGTTANTLCHVFAKRTPLSNVAPSVHALRGIVSDCRSRVIRVDLMSHSYVIEQIDSLERPLGNVYQSNVAVLSNPDLGITMHKYLHENPNPVLLDRYLQDLAAVSDESTSKQTRQALYLAMYTAPSYLKNPLVHPPNISDATTSSVYKLAMRQITYQDFRSVDVLSGVQRILTFTNMAAMVKSQEIYYQCSP